MLRARLIILVCVAGALVLLGVAWFALPMYSGQAVHVAAQPASVTLSPSAAPAGPAVPSDPAAPPVELEASILKIPAGARGHKVVQRLLAGLTAAPAPLDAGAARLLRQDMLLSIAPASIQVLSRPRLVLLSGGSAALQIAENVPIGSGGTPVRGDLILTVSPRLRADGATDLSFNFSASRAEGPVRVILDAAGLPMASTASAGAAVAIPPGGAAAMVVNLGADELLVILEPRPAGDAGATIAAPGAGPGATGRAAPEPSEPPKPPGGEAGAVGPP